MESDLHGSSFSEKGSALRGVFIDSIRADIRDLLFRIEQETDISIDFADATDPRAHAAADMSAIWGRKGVKIIVRDYKNISQSSALHELLHLERHLLLGIPAFRGKNTQTDWIAKRWENILEHIVIVPKQRDWGLDEIDFWDRSFLLLLEDYPWKIITNKRDRNAYKLETWLASRLAKNISRDVLQNKLRAERALADCWNFEKLVEERLGNKESLISFVCKYLGMNKDNFVLVYYDLSSKGLRFEEIK